MTSSIKEGKMTSFNKSPLSGRTEMDLARYAVTLHPRGRVHGVPEQAVAWHL